MLLASLVLLVACAAARRSNRPCAPQEVASAPPSETPSSLSSSEPPEVLSPGIPAPSLESDDGALDKELPGEGGATLPIPDRPQAKGSPPSGWCGETAIQEGLLHLGVWAPQRFINRAGKPVHPDLYSNEIPVALSALGVLHAVYTPRRAGFAAFERWVREALDDGDPVLAGVKILPTEHPEWGLDHFVLVVGHGEKGLLVNTTWGRRQWVADTTTPGLSFKNAFYAIRLRGAQLPGNAHPARLTVLDENESLVRVHVECSGLIPGARYRVERREGPDRQPVWSDDATAPSVRISKDLAVEAESPARFDCVPLVAGRAAPLLPDGEPRD